jgi:uncharacterized membrane protein
LRRVAEDDELEVDAREQDNSFGRLLALSDGVFAIAMTLLALELHLPDLGAHPTDHALRHALGHQWHSYLAFVVSFYVVANYWVSHRRALRRVERLTSKITTRTFLVLLLVAAVPFPASVLADYGGEPSSLAFYAIFNLVAGGAVLRVLAAVPRDEVVLAERSRLLADAVVFVLCIPLAYALDDNAAWLLLLLAVSGRVAPILARRAQAAHAE